MTCGRSCLFPSWVSCFPAKRGVELCTGLTVVGWLSTTPADTIGTSDLKETIQIKAAHVKAIRRLGNDCPYGTPKLPKAIEKGLEGKLPSPETRKVEAKHLWRAGIGAPPDTHPTSPKSPGWPRGSVCDSLGRRVTAAGCSGFSINWAYVF